MKPDHLKLLFFLPKKNDILILDKNAKQNFAFLEKRYDLEYVDIRGKEIYVWILLRSMLKIFSSNLSKIKHIYLVQLIRFINPKCVISLQDNNLFIYQLKKYFPCTKFMIIQNGLRDPSFFDRLIKKRGSADYIFVFNKAFGSKYTSHIEAKAVVIGSFKSNIIPISRKKSQDLITFVSSLREPGKNSSQIAFQRERSLANLFKATMSVSEELGCKVVVLGKYNYSNHFETDFYSKICDPSQFIFEARTSRISNYQLLDRSKFLVSRCSSLGIESYYRGIPSFNLCFEEIEENGSLRHCSFGWEAGLARSGWCWTDNADVSDLENRLIGFASNLDKAPSVYLERHFDLGNKTFERLLDSSL